MNTITEPPSDGGNIAGPTSRTSHGDSGACDPTAPPSSETAKQQTRNSASSANRDAHKVARWLHTYLGMISLLLVLFFGATGITLNHPSWTFGMNGTQQTVSGTLPAGFETNGTVDFLAVSQYLQETEGVRGDATDYTADATQGSMSFKGPGYAADVFFDLSTGGYDLTVDQEGLLAVMNDLHKGRNTGSAWNWTIDVAGGLLVAVAVTGLGLQFFLKRRRARAYLVAGVGGLISLLLIVLTVN